MAWITKLVIGRPAQVQVVSCGYCRRITRAVRGRLDYHMRPRCEGSRSFFIVPVWFIPARIMRVRVKRALRKGK